MTRVQKGRIGKLNWHKVREIRHRSTEICSSCGETPSNVALARQFGVSRVMVHKILKNKSWKAELDPGHDAG